MFFLTIYLIKIHVPWLKSKRLFSYMQEGYLKKNIYVSQLHRFMTVDVLIITKSYLDKLSVWLIGCSRFKKIFRIIFHVLCCQKPSIPCVKVIGLLREGSAGTALHGSGSIFKTLRTPANNDSSNYESLRPLLTSDQLQVRDELRYLCYSGSSMDPISDLIT